MNQLSGAIQQPYSIQNIFKLNSEPTKQLLNKSNSANKSRRQIFSQIENEAPKLRQYSQDFQKSVFMTMPNQPNIPSNLKRNLEPQLDSNFNLLKMNEPLLNLKSKLKSVNQTKLQQTFNHEKQNSQIVQNQLSVKCQILEDKIRLLEEALEEKNTLIGQLENENKQLIKGNLNLILNSKLSSAKANLQQQPIPQYQFSSYNQKNQYVFEASKLDQNSLYQSQKFNIGLMQTKKIDRKNTGFSEPQIITN